MAAFDFPSSPTTGQVFSQNGVAFVWNGYAWLGGQQQAGPQTEQFFDLAGLGNVDIPVPSWAKGVQIQSTMFMAASGASGPGLQVSFDGTTFLTGATDYQYMGFVQNTGSLGFTSIPQQGYSSFILSPVAGTINTIVPSTADYVLDLARKTTDVLMLRGTGRCYDNAATALGRNFTTQAWVSQGVAGANLRVQKLRFLTNVAGNYGVGSWLRLRWIGASAQVPTGNAISDAPADGTLYGRLNSAWTAALPAASPVFLGSISGGNAFFAAAGAGSVGMQTTCVRGSGQSAALLASNGTEFVQLATAPGLAAVMQGGVNINGPLNLGVAGIAGTAAVPVTFLDVWNTTSGTTANVNVLSSGRICRITSMRSAKKDITPLDDAAGDAVLMLKPSSFVFRNDPEAMVHFGFIADELADADEHFSTWGDEPERDEEGNVILNEEGNTTSIGIVPNAPDPVAIIAGLVNLVKRMDARIKALEAV